MSIRCLIIDDEQIAREIVRDYVLSMSDIEVIAEFQSAIDAISFLQENKIDLIFLDINMPKLNGLDFIRSLAYPPKVILITAYREYALDGFELNVVDYLLKPFSFERFSKAIQHYYTSVNFHKVNDSIQLDKDYFFVRHNRKSVKILYSNVLYIKSYGEYIIIVTNMDKVMIKGSLSKMEKLLAKDLFIRIHNSYIVSVKNISSVTHSFMEVDGIELPISRKYASEIYKKLGIRE